MSDMKAHLKDWVNGRPWIKQKILSLLMPHTHARPRWWVRKFVIPCLARKRGNTIFGSDIRWDIMPFNRIKLGRNLIIEDRCVLNNGMGDIIIGDGSHIGISNVIIGPVKIGEDCIFAQHVILSGLDHGYEDIHISPSKQRCIASPIIIEDMCWIGANAVLTRGVRVGKHSVVGAGSVVTKDVPAYSVAVGNPARVIKQYDFEAKSWKKVA